MFHSRPGDTLKYQIICFCLLAYLISWGNKFLMVAPDAGLFHHNIPKGVLQFFAQFGPTIAGIIMMIAADGKKAFPVLFNNLTRFNIRIKWYLFALMFELILFFIIVIVYGSLGLVTIKSGAVNWWTSLENFLLNTIYLTLLTGLGEEIGWRGFLLPRLQSSFPIILCSVILALVNSLWHLRTADLAVLLTGDLRGFWSSFLPDMGLRILISVPVIFVIVYLFNKTKGSLVIMILYHGTSNASYEWVKEITGIADPYFVLPIFAGLLWLTSVFFIPALLRQEKNKELVTDLGQ